LLEEEIELEKYVPCKDCKGTGSKDKGGNETCSDCGGNGQVISSRGFFQVQQTCPRCAGSGEVVKNPCKICSGEGRESDKRRIKIKIPAGVESGTRLRSVGNGDEGMRGGSAGDLYVVLHVREHEIFEREGTYLFCDVPLTFTTAALGGELEVPTLEGKASIKIPAGTQTGTTFRLKSKGMRELGGSRTGDLHITVQVEVPTKLKGAQKDKLKELAEMLGEENSPLNEGFLKKAKKFFS